MDHKLAHAKNVFGTWVTRKHGGRNGCIEIQSCADGNSRVSLTSSGRGGTIMPRSALTFTPVRGDHFWEQQNQAILFIITTAYLNTNSQDSGTKACQPGGKLARRKTPFFSASLATAARQRRRCIVSTQHCDSSDQTIIRQAHGSRLNRR